MSTFGPIAYNVDINQLGASQAPRFSVSQPTPYQDALVEDIILNENHPKYAKDGHNVGMAKIRFIPGDRGVPVENLNWAAPIDSSIREYPLKNELVLVFYSLGRLFYTRRINSTNKIGESTWPGLRERMSPAIQTSKKSDSAVIAAKGGSSYEPWKTGQPPFTVGDEFVENSTSQMLRPSEGDLIIHGRFGNSIRMGSSLFSNPVTKTPQPNLLMTVGISNNRKTSTGTGTSSVYSLVFEDINKDKSCIWMTVDEKIVLKPATMDSVAHLRSAEVSDSTKYTGAQIFINSDRLILNSKVNEISLFSAAEINLSAVQSVTIDSGKSVMITGERGVDITTPRNLLVRGNNLTFEGKGDILQSATGNNIILGRRIFIGSGGNTSQPMVLGGNLAQFLREFISILVRQLGPAIASGVAAGLVAELGALGVQQLGTAANPRAAVFNSSDNFVAETNS